MLTHVEQLREFKIFDELNERELEQIAKIAKTEHLGPGARLTEVGTVASNLYLIHEGRVKIMATDPDGKEVAVDEVGPGNIIGWSTLTGPYLYTASTATAEKSTLIVVNGHKLRQVFEINNHIGYRVLKGIGSVVAQRIAAFEKKTAHTANERN